MIDGPRKGIALVSVLFMLTIMALLASGLAVLMSIESKIAEMQLESLRAELLLSAGLDHAKTVLTVNELIEALDTSGRALRTSFEQQSPWYEVRDASGQLVGRYRLRVEDEAAKLNVNSAHLLDESRGAGWHTGEVAIPRALGVSAAFAEHILRFRYGGNRVPGGRGDDDANNTLLMADGIDNDADGIRDEQDEGVEDPGEYSYFDPRGDDRRFGTVEEVLSLLLTARDSLPLGVQQSIIRQVPRRVTIYSVDMPGSPTLPDDAPADINTVTAREARNRLRRANTRMPFEGATRNLDGLAANIVDYRDQNHVLSTVGSAYGVEAVCFNELLANDGTEGRFTASGLSRWWQNPSQYDHYFTKDISPDNPDFAISSSSLFYDWTGWTTGSFEGLEYNRKHNNWNYSAQGAWDVVSRPGSRRTVKLLGPAKFYSGSIFSEAWENHRMRRYKRYLEMCDNIGEYPRQRHGSTTDNPGFPVAPHSDYESPGWPPGFFKNCYLSVGMCEYDQLDCEDSMLADPVSVRIVDSDRDGTLRLDKAIRLPMTNAASVTRGIVWGWTTSRKAETLIRNICTRFTFQAFERSKYYLPIINSWGGSRRFKAHLGFGDYPGVWRDNREYPGTSHKWAYGGDGEDATPIRASRSGYMDVYLKSGDNLEPSGQVYSRGNYLTGVTFMRPEVLELVNVSPHDISIKNWTLTFNTGSIANDIGLIDHCYGHAGRGGNLRPNPVIGGGSYFYLVNNVKLFNAEFGSGTPREWGSSADQAVPTWQIPTESWGVQYRIDRVRAPDRDHLQVFVKNENFRHNQFRGEIFELQDIEGGRRDQKTFVHGSRYIIQENGRNWFKTYIDKVAWELEHFKPNSAWNGGNGPDVVLIVGMPAKGGVVSMTLKNQYKQIASRTVEYDYVDQDPRDWYGRSSEKIDPTHYNWRVVQTPSIGGREREARNRSTRAAGSLDVVIKNGAFNSVAELRKVRSSRDFQNIGAGGGAGENSRAVAALASAFCNSTVRLEAGDDSAERTGTWELSADAVQSVGSGSITGRDADWENGQWRGHIVRFLTGALRGESFPVYDNSRVALQVRDDRHRHTPRSSPGGKALTPARGDLFTVGPGYATPVAYARQSNAEGTWLWRSRVPIPGCYDLYIFGLNDSISTTEFLEENHNASLDVFVWNYSSRQFDRLCEREQYSKEDCFRAGRIEPSHVSASGDVKLKLVAHDVTEENLDDAAQDYSEMLTVRDRRSGYAWFNYAVLTPVPVIGRVNANTAGERLLASLPGIDATLARNIHAGVGQRGNADLKPYRTLGDLMAVEGMTLEAFERCANLVMLDSSTFTVAVEAQTFERRGSRQEARDEDILARQHIRYIVETTSDGNGAQSIRVLERTRL